MGVEKDNVTNFEVRVSIDNPGKELKANMTANAEIVLEEHAESLIVPEGRDHLRRAEERVRRVSRPARRPAAEDPVKVGVGNGTKIQILDGLKAGDKVVCPREARSRTRREAGQRAHERSHRPVVRTCAPTSCAAPDDVRHPVGMISVVVLSATGEGFRRGNDKVLRELGKNIAIVWGGRTSMQAGGERAGRQIRLTLDDARAIAAESSMIAVVSPEIERARCKVKSAYNAATARVTGIEPQYQDIRTIELEYGRNFTWKDEEQVSRVAIVGADMADQLFGKRNILNERSR
jgi:hypothetical protein